LSTTKKNYCDVALSIAGEIEASEYDADPNIAADVTVVRTICAGVNAGPSVGGDGTATPEAGMAPTATP